MGRLVTEATEVCAAGSGLSPTTDSCMRPSNARQIEGLKMIDRQGHGRELPWFCCSGDRLSCRAHCRATLCSAVPVLSPGGVFPPLPVALLS